MLPEALMTLAAAAGSGLVGAVMTDAWVGAKQGFSRLLGRGDQTREEMVGQQLERTRAELVAAGPRAEQVRSAQQAVWAARLEDLLTEHPEKADEVRALVEQIAAAGGGSVGSVTQHVVGFDQAQQAVQGHGTQIVHFGPAGSPTGQKK